MKIAHDVFEHFVDSQLENKKDLSPEQLKNLEHAFHAGLVAMANHAIPVIKFTEMLEAKKSESKHKNEINEFIQEKLKEKFPDIDASIHTIDSGSPLDTLLDLLGGTAIESFKKDFKSFCREAEAYAEKHFTDPNKNQKQTQDQGRIKNKLL